jgi:hypothetical protein
MSEVSMQQLYVLALDILSAMDRFEEKLDQLLLAMRATNRELSETRQFCENARRMRTVSE